MAAPMKFISLSAVSRQILKAKYIHIPLKTLPVYVICLEYIYC